MLEFHSRRTRINCLLMVALYCRYWLGVDHKICADSILGNLFEILFLSLSQEMVLMSTNNLTLLKAGGGGVGGY